MSDNKFEIDTAKLDLLSVDPASGELLRATLMTLTDGASGYLLVARVRLGEKDRN